MLTPGSRLDRYELLCPIASGGMATVWLARLRGKRGFEKLVAIKTIKTELITDPRYQEMFLDEARIASGIEHPNVAQILDLGEQDDNLYLVMEWVDGESLAKICRLANKRKRPVPLELALRVMADACAGLHAAHELRASDGQPLNVVHRDVSPHNILVTGSGAAKVIDFGVAKATRRGSAETQSGVVKGKIRYMAPEQVNGQDVDRRADIWAIGMCLHELATGKPPYDELGDLDVVRRLMTSHPEPEMDEALTPEPLRKVLARSLVKDPAARYPTAAAMRRGIEAALSATGVSPTSEDVAEFVTDVLPELAEWRKRTVTKALSAAQARLDSMPPDERAAWERATVPATHTSESDEAEVPLTRRKESSRPSAGPAGKVVVRVDDRHISTPPNGRMSDRPDPRDDSKTTGGATLTEQLGQRPRSRVGSIFFGAVIALALFATFVWPGVERMRAMTSEQPSPPSAEPSATIAAPPPQPSASTIELDPNVPPTPSASASASTPPATTFVAPRSPPRPRDPMLEPSDPAALAAAAAAAEAALRAEAGISVTAPSPAPSLSSTASPSASAAPAPPTSSSPLPLPPATNAGPPSTD